MSRQSYRKFLNLLEIWPVDQTKVGGRDLGEYLRYRIQQTYKSGDVTIVDERLCVSVCDSFMRLATDTHKNSYPRKSNSSCLGVSKEACSAALSNEALEQLRVDNMTLTERIKNLFTRK